jgi:hypothetical protein
LLPKLAVKRDGEHGWRGISLLWLGWIGASFHGFL